MKTPRARTQDFESEFVEILNQQCFRFLYQKLERARESPEGPLSTRNISMASSKEVLKYISELGISKVALRVEDIEAILVCISSIDLQNRQIPIEIVKLRAEVIFGICKELYHHDDICPSLTKYNFNRLI